MLTRVGTLVADKCSMSERWLRWCRWQELNGGDAGSSDLLPLQVHGGWQQTSSARQDVASYSSKSPALCKAAFQLITSTRLDPSHCSFPSLTRFSHSRHCTAEEGRGRRRKHHSRKVDNLEQCDGIYRGQMYNKHCSSCSCCICLLCIRQWAW